MRRSSLPLNSSTTISQSAPRSAGLEHASCRGISWPTKSLEVVLSPPLGLGRRAIGTSYAARGLLIESRHVSWHVCGLPTGTEYVRLVAADRKCLADCRNGALVKPTSPPLPISRSLLL